MTNRRLRELNGAFAEAAGKCSWHSPGWVMFSRLWNITWKLMRERDA